MEQWIESRLVGKEVEMLCVGGERLSGRLAAVVRGVATLAWEERESYVACDKIVAIWLQDETARESPTIGFAR